MSRPDDQQDVNLDAKLKEELSGIFHWALKGLARLRQRGQFGRTRSGMTWVQSKQHDITPMQAWLRETFEFTDDESAYITNDCGLVCKGSEAFQVPERNTLVIDQDALRPISSRYSRTEAA